MHQQFGRLFVVGFRGCSFPFCFEVRILACSVLIFRIVFIPPVILDQNNHKAFRDQANQPAEHVDNCDCRIVTTQHLRKPLNCANRLNNLKLLVPIEELVNHFTNSNISVFLGHVISQDRHLFRPDTILIDRPIKNSCHGVCNNDSN